MDEKLRLIDIEENTNLKSLEENNLAKSPSQSKEVPPSSNYPIHSQKVIDKLPTWSIEPPLEIKRKQE